MNDSPSAFRTHPLALLHRYGSLVALALVAAGAAVRIPGMMQWWLNPDEGIYYSTLTQPAFADFWMEVSENAHPPLYYLLLRGMGLFSWDFLWFRGAAFMCGVAGIWVFWLLGKELAGNDEGGTLAGLGSALIVAFAPGAIVLSQVMRPYTFQVLLLAGTLLCLLRYRERPSGRLLGGYVVLLCLSLLTHYSSVLAAGVFGMGVLYMGWEGGTGRAAWRRLLLAHAVPALVLATLYVVHIRGLGDSALANDALNGWLAPYMVHSPGQGWLAFIGFQSLLAIRWFRGTLAVLTLVGLVASLLTPRRLPLVLGGTALAVAWTAAALGVYPMGSTRHTAWLMVFLIPVAAFPAVFFASAARRTTVVAAATLVALLALGKPMGLLLGLERAPWAPTDHVLLRKDVARMLPALDPDGAPPVVLMSSSAYYLLIPFYTAEREAAIYSADRTLFHFSYGQRHMFVSTAWNFTSAMDGTGSADHLPTVVQRLASDFPADFDMNQEVSLLVGGWRPSLVDELLETIKQNPSVGSLHYVPGLFAFDLDLGAYQSVMEAGTP